MGQCNNDISGSVVLDLLTREELYKLYKRVERIAKRYHDMEDVVILKKRGKTSRGIAIEIGVSYTQVDNLYKEYDECSTHYNYDDLLQRIKSRVQLNY